MRDPVDRVLSERAQLDRGFASGFWLSLFAHFFVVGTVFGAQLVLPRQPPIRVVDGEFVVLPRGGGGVPDAPPPAPASQAPQQPAREVAPEPVPTPQVIKPPQPERPPEKTGPAAEPKAKPRRPRATPTPTARGGVPGGTGTGSQTPGVEFAAPGLGVPGGADENGDWYLAGVQRKIWMIWTQQINADFVRQVRVQFTLMADGRVTDVQVIERSGAALLDLAAQRAVLSAQPFGAFPPEYGGLDRLTIQANFKPTR